MPPRPIAFFRKSLLAAVVLQAVFVPLSAHALGDGDDLRDVSEQRRTEIVSRPTTTVPAAPASSTRFTPVIPALSVPIPGITFSPPVDDGNELTVPFLAEYISGIYRYLLGISTLVAIIVVISGGFLYLLGQTQGDAQKGLTLIKDAIGGLVVLYSSYLILWTVNPKLVNLQPLRLARVQSINITSDDAASDSASRDDDPATETNPPATGASGGGPTTFCRENLVRTPRGAGKRDVWCSACGCGVMKSGRPDNACLALTGSCGGGYGQFLDALTGHCSGKTFGWLEGLDGGTFGILHYTENEVAGLVNRLQAKDPEAYARVMAAARGLPVTNAAICASNRTDRGFVCNPGYRSMIEAALRERSFTLVQLEDSYNAYVSRRRSAERHGFRSAYGQALWATVANNPGRCNSRERGLFYNVIEACPAFRGGSENDRIECFLEKYVEFGCRDGAPGARRRVESIRRQLQGVSRSEAAPLPTLAQLEACVP